MNEIDFTKGPITMLHHHPHLSPFSLLSNHFCFSSFPSSHYIPFGYCIIHTMAVNFKYWDDCVDPLDMEAMWKIPEVNLEWLDAGETRGQKVHLSRDPDGQPYLTQTEMKAVVEIIVSRHFHLQVDPNMICAIAELESDRQPLSIRYDKKSKDTKLGIMQLFPKTAEWLYRELNYQSYEVVGNPDLLFRPFVSVYFGAAYLKWLSNFEEKERNEEFVVRAYRGGTKKATHKSTMSSWQRYLSVKESFPSRHSLVIRTSLKRSFQTQIAKYQNLDP
ncbi:hypothetical protein F8388_026718 [Cannabis sativa]|uniref:Transglycosylase SLT domain-containing protein n=1 Tax=Cannabis sativa TaxID=3483 RepID=A0A7J6H3J5_CANSA|nr:hypothetical protein F8388_026718 [Cannabis sativa]